MVVGRSHRPTVMPQKSYVLLENCFKRSQETSGEEITPQFRQNTEETAIVEGSALGKEGNITFTWSEVVSLKWLEKVSKVDLAPRAQLHNHWVRQSPNTPSNNHPPLNISPNIMDTWCSNTTQHFHTYGQMCTHMGSSSPFYLGILIKMSPSILGNSTSCWSTWSFMSLWRFLVWLIFCSPTFT